MRGDTGQVIAPREHGAVLRRGWWLLLTAPLVAAVATHGFLAWRGPTYSASAILLVQPDVTAGDSAAAVAAAQSQARTFSHLATTPAVLQRVIARLGLQQDVDRLADHVKARAESETQAITITADATTPRQAAAVANALGEEFVQWLTDVQVNRLNLLSQVVADDMARVVDDLAHTAANLNALRDAPGPKRPTDQQQLAALEARQQLQRNAYSKLADSQIALDSAKLAARTRVALVMPAQPPSDPTGLPHALALGLAAVVGVGASAAGLLLWRRATDPLEQAYAPATWAGMASLPQTAQGHVGAPAGGASAHERLPLGAFISVPAVAANLQERGAVLVSGLCHNGCRAGLGLDVALTLAKLGHRVVLVDANLSSPSPGLSTADEPGLADLVANPTWVVGSRAWRLRHAEEFTVSTAVPGLRLMRAGSSRARVADAPLENVLCVLKAIADYVVVIGPPLDDPAAWPLALRAGRALLVADPAHSSLPQLTAAAAGLSAAGAIVLGFVLYRPGAEARLAGSLRQLLGVPAGLGEA